MWQRKTLAIHSMYPASTCTSDSSAQGTKTAYVCCCGLQGNNCQQSHSQYSGPSTASVQMLHCLPGVLAGFLTGKHKLPALCVHSDAHQQHAHSAPFNHHTNPLPPTPLNTPAPCPALPTSVKPKAPTRPPSLCCCAERIRLCVGRIALARQAEQRPRPSAAVDVQPAVDDFSRVCLLSLVSNEPRHCRLIG